MDLKVTRLDVDDGIAWVRLHRPERHNSWTARMHTEYRWIMARCEADPAVRVAVLTGSGNTFCVGADSTALSGYADQHERSASGSSIGTAGYDQGLSHDVATPGHGVRGEFDADIAWQLGLRFPLICAVNGSCAGVAMALAAYADIRFAVAGAKVTTATAKLAMPAEYGLSWILPRLVGLTNAADILLSGRILRAEELGGMGFFNKVYPREEFDAAVADYARQIARLSPEATTATKRQLYDDLLSSDPGASVRRSTELIGELMGRPDFAEGVRALNEKRPPRFGRQPDA